jgi:hypothetical protein
MEQQTNTHIRSIGFILFISLFTVAGCTSVHVVEFWPNTDPPGAHVATTEGIKNAKDRGAIPLSSDKWWHFISEEERRQGAAILPEFVIEKAGYLDYTMQPARITLDEAFWKSGADNGRGQIVHSVRNTVAIHLERNPDFWGSSDNPNKLYLTINSEPPGARVYIMGKLFGTTPCEVWWNLMPEQYKLGSISCGTVVVVKEGYAPHEEQSIVVPIYPELRYEQGKRIDVAKLFMLSRDQSSGVIASQPYQNSETSLSAGSKEQEKAAAKAEYEQALAAYEKALQEYNDTKTLVNAPKAYPHPALGVLMKSVAEPSLLAEKEKALEIAKQRLERAKDRINHAEW